jgi:hypothetical protein
VNGGRRRSVELVAAPDVAVDDGGAAQGGGSLRRGLACLDNDPEQRWLDEAQHLAHPGEVEGMRGAGARGRDDDEQLVWVGGEVDRGRGGGREGRGRGPERFPIAAAAGAGVRVALGRSAMWSQRVARRQRNEPWSGRETE